MNFASKEELLAAVAVAGFQDFAALLNARLAAAGPSPLERLRTVAATYVLFATTRPAAFRVMYAPYATVNEGAPELVRARDDAHRASQTIIVEAQAAGLLREGDPLQIALVLWSSMHGLAVLLTEGQLGRYDQPTDAANLANLVSSWIFHGVAPNSLGRAPR